MPRLPHRPKPRITPTRRPLLILGLLGLGAALGLVELALAPAP